MPRSKTGLTRRSVPQARQLSPRGGRRIQQTNMHEQKNFLQAKMYICCNTVNGLTVFAKNVMFVDN